MKSSSNTPSRKRRSLVRRSRNGMGMRPVWGAILALVLVAMAPAVSRAAGTGTWALTAPMTTARYLQSATLLPGFKGLVLVAGGQGTTCSSSCDLASAELYDPATRTWTPTGSMATARDSQTATLLPNGKVLVAGGETCSPLCTYLTSAELYDPTTGTWTPTGSMHVTRELHTATLLPNGKVLVAGGCCPSTAGAELYDPQTGLWTPTGSLKPTRDSHIAALLSDGEVLVTGGESEFCAPEGCGPYGLSSAALYDPLTGTWKRTGRMSIVRVGARAASLPGGRVLVVGGSSNPGIPSSMLASAEVYDPLSGTWSSAGAMTDTRAGHTATLLADGQVLVTGGLGDCTPFCHILGSAELYSP